MTFVSALALRHPARWLLWSALAIHVPIALVGAAQSRLPSYDFDRYYDIATSPGRPYVDFPVEYPPGTVLVLRTVVPAAGDRARFGVALVLLNVVADLAIVAALGWGWGLAAAAAYAVVVIPILDLFVLRADLWSTAFVTIAVAAWRRDRRIVTALCLAAGAALKLWPLAFFALLLVPARGRGRLAAVAAAAAAGAAVLAGWVWIAGWTGVYQVLTFRGARGWEIESAVGSVWMLIGQSTMRVESGAWRIGTLIGPVSILMFAAAVLPCLWCIWRGGRTSHEGAGWIGGISALLVVSAILSPQYSAWLAPAGAVAWAQGDRRLASLTALAIFLTNLVWKSFNPLVHGAMGPLVMLLARNLLLALIAVDATRLLRRAPPGRSDILPPSRDYRLPRPDWGVPGPRQPLDPAASDAAEEVSQMAKKASARREKPPAADREPSPRRASSRRLQTHRRPARRRLPETQERAPQAR